MAGAGIRRVLCRAAGRLRHGVEGRGRLPVTIRVLDSSHRAEGTGRGPAVGVL